MNKVAPSILSYREKERLLIEAMDKYGSFILGYLNSLCHDHTMAEDVSQQLWVYVYSKFEPQYYEHAGFLKNKAYQLFVDECRKRKVRSFVTTVESIPDSPAPPPSREPSNTEEEKQLYDDFWEQFSSLQLKEKHKEIFWLHARLGYTMQEISGQLNVATSTANDWLRLIKKQCLEHLNQQSS